MPWFHLAHGSCYAHEESGTDAYANEDSTQVIVLCFLALPLLPVNHIELVSGRQSDGWCRHA